MKEINCNDCGKEERRKYIKKIKGKYYCKKCNSKNRQERREETINNSGIKEELKELERKAKRIYNREYQRKRYEKIKSKRTTQEDFPKIKGSKLERKEKSNAYLQFEERQVLFGMLIKKGLDGEDAKERINDLIEQQKQIRETMKQKNKSEQEIEIKQQELLEELWNY